MTISLGENMTISATRIRGKERQEIEQDLKTRVDGEVKFDPFSRVLYSTDASIYQMEPIGVVIPKNTDDVQATIEYCSQNNIPILPRAGGTSLAGQTVNHAVVIDFSKYLTSIIEINEEEHWARVQPGIILDQFNKQLSPYNLHYAPDPTTASRACVGGGIGNNTCGSHSVIYGKTIDHIQELDVILSDASQAHFKEIGGTDLENKLNGTTFESDIYRGVLSISQNQVAEIEKRYPKILRRVSGYNLDNFMLDGPVNMSNIVVGSEGTLCVVTEAKVNLVSNPTVTGLSVLHFKDIIEASYATTSILEYSPSTIEVMDKMLLDRCRESLGFSQNLSAIEGDPGAILLIEFYGESVAEVESKMEKLKSDMARKRFGYACVNLSDKPSQNNVWNIRKAGLGLLMSIHGDAKPIPFVEDTAVDPAVLGDFVKRFDSIVKSHGTEAGYYGHASVGCLHIRPLISLKNDEGIAKMFAIADEISDLVSEFGGSLSGEHGDGIVRGVFTEKMFGPEIYQAFRDLKATFDPQGIMNPNKIIDCPPMEENLRYGKNYSPQPVETVFDFSIDGDYAGAIEMCNGMGACRKLEGSMCPSYMATRDEEHSTRGRANLLRATLSGDLPDHDLSSKRLYESLDLCLECKACKSECPSGVDMTKLKYEFLNKYYTTNKMPLRNKVFGNINKFNKVGSQMAPLANFMMNSLPGKIFGNLVLGVSMKRQFPKFANESLNAWFNKRNLANTDVNKETVVFFNDTFTNYNYPNAGKAAIKVLETAGFNVELADSRCCGRPLMSKGLLEEAKANARYNVDMLHAYVSQGIPVVGCEPSCVFTLTDEYPDLLSDDKSKLIAENTFLIDEFLSKKIKENKIEFNFNDSTKDILFHGHCHQKALNGAQYSMEILRLSPNYNVELIDAGCCGMAGSFGYEKEHYDLSMKIGGDRLFPAVNNKGSEWEIAVMGVSCRQQIEHGTERHPKHMIELFAECLK
jgi:anaerobic glycerol-3-phosphate dehydrogenase C subunit